MNISVKLHSLTDIGEDIHIIAITGGPCAGKTTGLVKLEQMLKDRGYKVLVSPETATKMIRGGFLPWEAGRVIFQKHMIVDSLVQEEGFIKAAMALRDLGHKVVMLCDRGIVDGQAYTESKEEFEGMVTELGLTLNSICNDRYHAVIHLRTAALGAEEFYTLDNNSARKETPEQARAFDQKILEAWQRHHHPRVVDNATGFDEKINRLLAEVCSILGDPLPLEIEQKFLIEPLDFSTLPVHVTESQIVQDYLISPKPDEEHRVRARTDDWGTSYFYTVKRHKEHGVRFETEKVIDKKEYLSLLNFKDSAFTTIKKQRSCFFYETQFVEVDTFEAPAGFAGQCVMEIEQTAPSAGVGEQKEEKEKREEIVLPPFVKVIKNVTGEEVYSNRGIAQVV